MGLMSSTEYRRVSVRLNVCRTVIGLRWVRWLLSVGLARSVLVLVVSHFCRSASRGGRRRVDETWRLQIAFLVPGNSDSMDA